MAVRPVFLSDDVYYVRKINTEFVFFNGFAKTQKQRCIDSLHASFGEEYPDVKVLEVSRYSRDELGNALSAFSLLISLEDGTKVPVESAYQSGKIFEYGGPYKDLLHASPKAAKTDPRLKESGRITGFAFEGRQFPAEPQTLFYTWLYLHGLEENPELADRVFAYDAFTDIVFNPEKSNSCQADVCALYVALRRKGEVRKALDDIDFLATVLGGTITRAKDRRRPAPQDKPLSRPSGSDSPSPKSKMLSFKENDIVVHPKYGEGKIKRIEKGTAETYLTVAFGDLEKTLAGSWVSKNCNIK